MGDTASPKRRAPSRGSTRSSASDLTEVDPIYDAAGVTPRIAAKLLLDVLGAVFSE
jgi:arginase family enzyme